MARQMKTKKPLVTNYPTLPYSIYVGIQVSICIVSITSIERSAITAGGGGGGGGELDM